MSQVNPLHIGALLIALLAFLFFSLSGVKQELQEEQELFAQSQKLALELTSLKDVYAQKEKTLSSLQRLLSQSSLKSSGLTMKKGKDSLTLSSASLDANALNSLMGKLLNGSYKIAGLNITRLSETKASLEVEILW
jgi:hypothetical protein